MHLVVNGRFLAQPVTGVQRYARELMTAMDAEIDAGASWTIDLLVPRLTEPPPRYKHIRVTQVGRLQGHAWEQWDLPRFRGAHPLFCPANTAPLATLWSGAPVVVTVHDLSYRYFPDAYSPTFRMVYNTLMPAIMRSARSIITVSAAERAKIADYYPAALPRIVVVPNGGAPSATAERKLQVPEQIRPYFLYVGSFSRRKNFAVVLKAASILLKTYPDFHFVFVGGSPKVLTEVDTSDYGGDKRMVFAGQVNDPAKLMSYYGAAELLIFPSLYESSGLPPVEAMACGCPVLVSRIPALVERCGEAALYCDPHDVDDIVSSAIRMMEDRGLRARVVARGLTRSQQFTWQACAEQTLLAIKAAMTPAGAACNEQKQL